CKTLAPTMSRFLNEERLFGADEPLEPVLELNGASASELRSSRPDDCLSDLRHPCRRCSGPRAEREHVQKAKVSLANEMQRVPEHRIGFRGKAGDQIGAERRLRANAPN